MPAVLNNLRRSSVSLFPRPRIRDILRPLGFGENVRHRGLLRPAANSSQDHGFFSPSPGSVRNCRQACRRTVGRIPRRLFTTLCCALPVPHRSRVIGKTSPDIWHDSRPAPARKTAPPPWKDSLATTCLVVHRSTTGSPSSSILSIKERVRTLAASLRTVSLTCTTTWLTSTFSFSAHGRWKRSSGRH